ncbi:MAG: putative DNA binding domain-containing protein [Parachlamydia sp.]|nr:putative DNA binding domain-containing protein [Parachlamydia sp.]
MYYTEQESQSLEFKSDIPQNEQILKTAIGFCNGSGGRIVLGVAKDGTIIGLEEKKVIQTMEWLEKSIYEAATPPIVPKVLSQRLGEKVILIVEVSGGMNKPYYRRSEGLEKGTYVRMGRSTIRASFEMIEELKWQSRGLSYDVMPLYQAKEEDLDQKKLLEFLKKRRNKGKISLTTELLKSYKLICEEHSSIYPTVAGILLFGKNIKYWLSEAMIICTHFSGTSGREALAARDFQGDLFEQFNEAYAFIISRLNYAFTIRGPKRKEKLEIPEIAVRELLLNAIIHRNYHIRAPTKIAIFDDRVEIFSPGSFPTPFQNLRLGMTDVRNLAICNIFREADYIEKLGSGFLTVFESYEKAGLPEPEIINGENFVKCILPRRGFGAGKSLDDKQKILQLFLTADALSVSDVIQALRLPRSTASRHLVTLVREGKLVRRGIGKGTKYFLAK